jgi:hypothetical protein
MEASIIAHAWLTPANFSFVCSTGGVILLYSMRAAHTRADPSHYPGTTAHSSHKKHQGGARSAPQIEAGARFRHATASELVTETRTTPSASKGYSRDVLRIKKMIWFRLQERGNPVSIVSILKEFPTCYHFEYEVTFNLYGWAN